MFWLLLLLSLVILATLGLWYLSSRLVAYAFLPRHLSSKKRRAVALCLLVGIFFLLVWIVNLWNAIIIFLHLVVFVLVFDGLALLFHQNRLKAGLLALLVTILYLLYGYYSLHHVVRTEYNFNTSKDLGGKELRIVGFSDSHAGTTFHGKGLQKYVERMNEEHPDLFVIVGDFVDDDSTREDMEECCKALSSVEATYGVYYVYGNHDRGYYSEARRGYSEKDLLENLEKNGVVVLKDEVVPIVGEVYLCGREDAGRNRTDIASLVAGLPEESYIITLDHQPNDYKAEAEAAVDLVLSGHTHGGQFFPILKVSEWTGMNDATYGYRRIGNTDFLVSSGISNWTLQFKTGCFSEYFVINLHKE